MQLPSSVISRQAPNPLSVTIEDRGTPLTGAPETARDDILSPRDVNYFVDSSMSSVPPVPGGNGNQAAPSASVPDPELDWMLQNGLYDLSFSLPDMGYLFPWLAQSNEYAPSNDENCLSSEARPLASAPFPGSPSPGQAAQTWPRAVCSYIPGKRAMPTFPSIQPSDYDTLNSENYGHVSPIPDRVYQEILSFYETQLGSSSSRHVFPEKSIIDGFVQLYIEHFDPLMPFVHHSLFNTGDTHWLLALAVATVGSQYTSIGGRTQYIIALLELLRRALPDDVR
ncbi:hypothetical protein BDV11DRAFT_175837 [Aspergillus similis]